MGVGGTGAGGAAEGVGRCIIGSPEPGGAPCADMAAGGALGMAAVSIPFVEPGIVASVLVLGVLIAAAVRLPLPASALLVGMFALFHGYAHGAEMPGSASGLAYGLGFVAATASLHLSGIGLGLLAQRFGSARLVRYAGGAIAACGVYLCFPV